MRRARNRLLVVLGAILAMAIGDSGQATSRRDAVTSAGPAATSRAGVRLHAARRVGPRPPVAAFLPYIPGYRLEDRLGIGDVWDDVDYSDPTSGGEVPLVDVLGRWAEPLGRHFTVRDFASRDGAPKARIARELVDALDLLADYSASHLDVHSGYRHPALNFVVSIGGATESQHMAGKAADLSSPIWSPLELAQQALDVLGCSIGIGLGRGFIHVDVRGYLASWTAPGAAMSEADFDAWVYRQCGLVLPEAAPGPDSTAAVHAVTDMYRYRPEAAAYARVRLRQGVTGAVVLDFRVPAGGAPYKLSFVEAGSPEAAALGAEAAIRHCRFEDYFVLVLIESSGLSTVGVLGLHEPTSIP